jgi:cytochrome P450
MNLTCDFAGIDRPKGTQKETDRLLLLMRTFALGTTLAHSKDDREKVRQQVRAALSAFDKEFLKPSMTRRYLLIKNCEAGKVDDDELPRDVLTVLLHNEDQIELDDQELVREIAFFVVAGAQTSIHSLLHVMHEIFTWSTDRPGERQKLLSDPMLLQRCVHESARLHPSSPVARRRAERPLTLATDEAVKSGELVTIDLLGANRDEKIFGPDAAEFNPYRQTHKVSSPYGLSFGLGMHACIGRTLAAGVTPKPDSDPLDHQYGTITLIASVLLEHGACPDPEKQPKMDEKTQRPNWGYYPVILDPPKS